MTSVWVTGFEPFAGVPENPSSMILDALPAELDGVRVQTAVLPTDTNAVLDALAPIYESEPSVLIHVGVAESRDVVSVERVAVNQRSFSIPDNAGNVIVDQPVIEGAPDQMASRLPTDAVYEAIRNEELPVERSDSAGTFLCNQVMFTSLYRLPERCRTGFLHVPAHPRLAAQSGRRGLSLARITNAVLTTLRVSLVALLFVLLGSADAIAGEQIPFMKGMTVSCPGYGEIWGAEPMRDSIRAVKKAGVEWVAIHPYARVRTDGSIVARPAAETGYLPRAVTIAKEEKVHLLWKPHLAYWGSFEWRGAIDFGNDQAAWKRFFKGYREFIVDQARFAQRAKAPFFSVGIEYAKTMGHEKAWRSIIADVRRVYRGKITYAANWDDYHRVPFWDALDIIGVQAYFPLGGTNPPPTRKQVEKAWDGHLAALRSLSKRYGNKPVVFTEIGYPRSPHAAAEPWKPDVDRTKASRDLRRMLLEVAFDKVGKDPLVRGMFWWKWLPGRNPWQQDFSMKDKEAFEAMGRSWVNRPGKGSRPASR